MEKENWINEILESTNGINLLTPDTNLFLKIQNRIESQKTVAPKWVWLAAASILILVMLNIKFVLSKTAIAEKPTELIAATITKSNQLY